MALLGVQEFMKFEDYVSSNVISVIGSLLGVAQQLYVKFFYERPGAPQL